MMRALYFLIALPLLSMNVACVTPVAPVARPFGTGEWVVTALAGDYSLIFWNRCMCLVVV